MMLKTARVRSLAATPRGRTKDRTCNGVGHPCIAPILPRHENAKHHHHHPGGINGSHFNCSRVCVWLERGSPSGPTLAPTGLISVRGWSHTSSGWQQLVATATHAWCGDMVLPLRRCCPVPSNRMMTSPPAGVRRHDPPQHGGGGRGSPRCMMRQGFIAR